MQPFRQVLQHDSLTKSISFFAVNLDNKLPFWHYHSEIELAYILSGACTLQIGDYVGRYKKGQLLVIGKDLPHDINVSDSDGHCNLVVLHFNELLFKHFPEMNHVIKLIDRSARGILFKQLPDSVHQLFKDFKGLDQSSQLIQVLSLLDSLGKSTERNKPVLLSSIKFSEMRLAGNTHKRLQKVLNYVNENKHKTIALKEVADFTHMTVPAFCRWFKKSMLISFVNYLNKLRVQEACRMLLNSDQPISVIAIESGFVSLSNFNRTFVKLNQVTPSEYRRMSSDG